MFNVFVLTEKQHEVLESHLFPKDGKEALSILLCGNSSVENRNKFTVHKIFNIPYADCELRSEGAVLWQTKVLEPLLEEADKKSLSVFKIHSHPTGYRNFSSADNSSDQKLFPSLYGWIDHNILHGSLLMFPCGEIKGRIVHPDSTFSDINMIAKVGDNIKFWLSKETEGDAPIESMTRNIQAFGRGTYNILKNLKVGIVGYSGTGSPTFEQLLRLGVGEIYLADGDTVEKKNLNRILNSTMKDVENKLPKVEVAKRISEAVGVNTKVKIFHGNIWSREAINELGNCDILFGCMDSVDGRHLVNRISTFYLAPYFDIGVKLVADGQGGIGEICGSSDYLQPGLSSLLSRHRYSQEKLRSAILKREDPEQYKELLAEKYIEGGQEESPAVISVNMLFSSLAVNDFLARIHPYRHEKNNSYAQMALSLAMQELLPSAEEEFSSYEPWAKYVGRADMLPLLDMPDFGGANV